MYWYKYKYKEKYNQKICIASAKGGLEKRKANQDRLIFFASTRFLTMFSIFTYFGILINCYFDSS